MANIRPVHKNAITRGSTSSYGTVTNFLTGSARGFIGSFTRGSTSTYSSTNKSGFQYIGGGVAGPQTFTRAFTEYAPATDTLTSLAIHEYMHEFVEYNPVSEVTAPGIVDYIRGSLAVNILSASYFQGGLTIGIGNYDKSQYSTNIGVRIHDLIPTTDVDNPSNNFEPTVVINGSIVTSNPSTTPVTAIPPDANFVNILPIPVTGSDCSNIQSFTMGFDFTGGSFQIESTNPILGANKEDNLFKVLALYGFTGMVSRFGESFSRSGAVWKTSGIFGSPSMNKKLGLLLMNNPYLFSLLTNQQLSEVQASSWSTFGGVAQQVALEAGVSLQFLVNDIPFTEFSSSEDSNVQSALGIIAAQVGGELRWNGNNSYVIVYPNTSAGVWNVPFNRLIEAMSYEWIADIENGVSGTGTIGLPILSNFDPGTKELASSGVQEPEAVQVVYTRETKIGVDEIIPPIELPIDTQSLKMQIIPKKSSDLTLATGSPGVTDNESIWYDLGNPSVFNPRCKYVNDNGTVKVWAFINSQLFPTASFIASGKFTFRLGVVRYSQKDLYAQAKKERDAKAKQYQAMTVGQFQYVKTYEGTITSKLFGAIPLPGMWGSATNSCGKTVEGIIQSVSVSAGRGQAPTITVQLAQFLKINFYKQAITLTAQDFTP